LFVQYQSLTCASGFESFIYPGINERPINRPFPMMFCSLQPFRAGR
jgi:hypothetical protein